MKKFLFTILAVGSLLTANAALTTDSILNGGTNTIPVATTNVYGGGTIFNCQNSSEITFEFSFTCTNANAMKAGDGPTFSLDAAVNGSASDIWKSNILFVVVPNVGSSNTASILTNLPPGLRYPFYRVGQGWNTNVSGTNFTGVKVRCNTKNGI